MLNPDKIRYAWSKYCINLKMILHTKQLKQAYLADVPEVAEAKVAFKKVFDAYKAGEIPLPVAPVHEIKPVCKFL